MTASDALAQQLHLRIGRTVSVRPATRDDEASIWTS
jgi:hypothetical protein